MTQPGSNKFSEVSEVEEHAEFIQMLIDAKGMADLNQEPIPVAWRGHKTVVKPNLSPFTKAELKIWVNNAVVTD